VRVAIFCNDYYPTIGGVQTAVRGMAAGLHQRGHEVLVLTRQPGQLPKRDRVDAADVYRFSWTLRPVSTLPVRWLRARRDVAASLSSWQPDVVYAHFVSMHALYARMWARRAGIPLILSFRGNDAMRIAPRNFASERVFARLTEDADIVLFSSAWLARETQGARWLRRPRRVGVLADAVDVTNAEVGSCGVRYVLAGGRFVHKKGFDLLLRAWSTVGREIEAPLWLAGDGPERGALEALVSELQINDRVRFLGPGAKRIVRGSVARGTVRDYRGRSASSRNSGDRLCCREHTDVD
jgi:glycogen(starch) synthase